MKTNKQTNKNPKTPKTETKMNQNRLNEAENTSVSRRKSTENHHY